MCKCFPLNSMYLCLEIISFIDIIFTRIESINPKRAGLFGPISQPGGADSAPPKISETD